MGTDPWPQPPIPRPVPSRPSPPVLVPHSPCPGSCAQASVRARGKPRAGRAPGVPPSPPLYPAGAASPIARPLLCAGPDSMHASYSGGGAPAASGARVRARGRGRAARSRGAPTAPDSRSGGTAAGGGRGGGRGARGTRRPLGAWLVLPPRRRAVPVPCRTVQNTLPPVTPRVPLPRASLPESPVPEHLGPHRGANPEGRESPRVRAGCGAAAMLYGLTLLARAGCGAPPGELRGPRRQLRLPAGAAGASCRESSGLWAPPGALHPPPRRGAGSCIPDW